MTSINLYIPSDKVKTVKAAKRLLAYHEGKTLSQTFIERCEAAVATYKKDKTP